MISNIFSILYNYHNLDSYALTDEAADKIRLPQLWTIIKKRGNKKKSKKYVRDVKLVQPTMYDRDGKRIVEEEDDDIDDVMQDNDEVQEGEIDDSDDEFETEEEEEDDEEDEDEKELIYQRLQNENNNRIRENNRREEEIIFQKDQNKKKNRNVIVRTLSGKINPLLPCRTYVFTS